MEFRRLFHLLLFSHVVDEFAADPELTLTYIIADTPERHFLKGLVHHSGKSSCEYCTTVAASPPVNWPFRQCYGAPERTPEQLRLAAL